MRLPPLSRLPWTNAHPRGQMSGIRERIELPSDLSKQSFQNPLTDSSDRIKLLHQFFLWLEALFDLVIESPNGSLKRLNHLQQLL